MASRSTSEIYYTHLVANVSVWKLEEVAKEDAKLREAQKSVAAEPAKQSNLLKRPKIDVSVSEKSRESAKSAPEHRADNRNYEGRSSGRRSHSIERRQDRPPRVADPVDPTVTKAAPSTGLVTNDKYRDQEIRGTRGPSQELPSRTEVRQETHPEPRVMDTYIPNQDSRPARPPRPNIDVPPPRRSPPRGYREDRRRDEYHRDSSSYRQERDAPPPTRPTVAPSRSPSISMSSAFLIASLSFRHLPTSHIFQPIFGAYGSCRCALQPKLPFGEETSPSALISLIKTWLLLTKIIICFF